MGFNMRKYTATEINLIDFFSEYNIEHANSKNGKDALFKKFKVNNYKELLKNEEFIKYYEPFKSLRQELYDSIAGLTGIDQVQSCLALLNEKKKSKKKKEIEILKKWINNKMNNCLYKSWNRKEKTHYTKALRIIDEWSDFFFSYTNRGIPLTNNDFKEHIIYTFGERYFDDYKDEINLVAKLIVRHLIDNGLQAFFDQDNIKCGDEIEDEIKQHCKSCYVFIQLAERTVFINSFKKKNWCYLEFEKFDNWISKQQDSKKRYHFIITEKDVFPEQMPQEYEHWRRKIEKINYCIISGLNIIELRDKIDELAKEIYNTKNKILKRYLGDFV